MFTLAFLKVELDIVLKIHVRRTACREQRDYPLAVSRLKKHVDQCINYEYLIFAPTPLVDGYGRE